MRWEEISFIISGKLRFTILLSLKKSPKTPSELKVELGTQISNISKTLRELESRGLIKCLTPERRKNKFYSITDKGLTILEEIKTLSDKGL